MTGQDDKKRPAALNLTVTRKSSSDSSSSYSSLQKPRTPRFAEATSVHSPVDGPPRSLFAADSEKSYVSHTQPGDIGFGYLDSKQPLAVPMTPKTPLKSAMRVPGTPARFDNPMSPTFRQEDLLEKREVSTEKEQARDLKIKMRVRMAKVALRGVNFSCALIILAMLSASFAIFNATKALPNQSSMPAWAKDTNTWPQKLVLAMACVSLAACILVFLAYCRGGHRRAEKVATYYTLFAIGWFIVSMLLWAITAALYQNSRNSSNNKDMWGWACVDNTRSTVYGEKVDYQLVCRLQNWTMICIIIEIVIEVICITLYSVVFYRYYTKRRLTKSMDMRDRARSDLYLAQLRSQSAPNTPGFGPKSPSAAAMSPRYPPAIYRNLADIEESPFTPSSDTHSPQSAFKLQDAPKKAVCATPKTDYSEVFTTTPAPAPRGPTPPVSDAVQQQQQQQSPRVDSDEPVYEAVPIPGAYSGQEFKSPPPSQVNFGQNN